MKYHYVCWLWNVNQDLLKRLIVLDSLVEDNLQYLIIVVPMMENENQLNVHIQMQILQINKEN